MPLPANEVLDDFLTNQRQEVKAALVKLAVELASAERKHPSWPTDIVHRAAIISEEAGEVTKAALHLTYEGAMNPTELLKEVTQTGATCLRFLIQESTMTVNNSLNV